MATLYADDLIVRTHHAEPHKFQANSFATLEELDNVIKFRVDAAVWEALSESDRVRVAVAAYKDLIKLCWSNQVGLSQSRDYEFDMRYGVTTDPPIGIPDFDHRIREAQAIQAVWIASGTQARDMARDGIKMNRALTGSEVEFSGYLGPVCAEAKEVVAPYLELYPRMRRF